MAIHLNSNYNYSNPVIVFAVQGKEQWSDYSLVTAAVFGNWGKEDMLICFLLHVPTFIGPYLFVPFLVLCLLFEGRNSGVTIAWRLLRYLLTEGRTLIRFLLHGLTFVYPYLFFSFLLLCFLFEGRSSGVVGLRWRLWHLIAWKIINMLNFFCCTFLHSFIFISLFPFVLVLCLLFEGGSNWWSAWLAKADGGVW